VINVKLPSILDPTVDFHSNQLFWHNRPLFRDTVIGSNTIIERMCEIWGGSVIGKNCHIKSYNRIIGIIGNGSCIDDCGTINADVGIKTYIGSNATILCGKIGSSCNIGDGVGIGLLPITHSDFIQRYIREFDDRKTNSTHISIIGDEVEINNDVLIYSQTRIDGGAKIGENTIIERRAHVHSGMVIPANSHIGPNVKITDELLSKFKEGHSPVWWYVFKENYKRMKQTNLTIDHEIIDHRTIEDHSILYFPDRVLAHQFLNYKTDSEESEE